MKVSELSIGDWVLDTEFDRNEPDRVCIVEDDGRVWLKNRNCYQSVTYCAPIPITPEILEKNGFYYGYTSNEEDIASNTIAQLSEEEKGWVWDEGAGSVKVIFPNESDGGEIQICDQGFDRNMAFGFSENIMLHELQHALKLCGIKKEIEL